MIDKKQIGVFSGSFNPIHMGHLMLANYITEFTHIDEIWFVVTPHNPLKVVSNLAEEETRLKMCQLAVEDFPKLKVSEIEFSMPKPSFTVDTLDKLKNEYPELCFTLIIGADNWNEFHLWKEYKRIREENEILIYPRLGEELIIETPFSNNVKSVDAPILQISSTFIRTSIRKGKDIRAFLPNKVHEYIETHKLYR
jgi:nicotinate-nucleotide adenylyltransferase